MIRKTLIIGLGGTGCAIAGAVAERLVWEHGSLARVPFVDFLCLDTAEDMIGGVLNDKRYFHHLTIDQATIDKMRLNARDFDPMLRLTDWIDQAMLRTMGVVRTGTQGFRMLGRLSLLVQDNFQGLAATLSSKLQRLLQLTQEEASEIYGSPVQFTRAARVFVVGTSCGGTGSGTYVDFGYLLRDHQTRYPNQLETVGILTLPATNVTDTRKTANTYALLTELNHYSTDGNDYRVKYPDAQHPQESVIHDYPYDMTYLVTLDVSRAAVGGLRDFDALKRTLGQYIHADVMTRMGAVADGRRNDITGFFSVPDRRGNNQRFMTLGIAFLEYPLARVVRGSAARLLVETLEPWLAEARQAFDVRGTAEKLGLDNAWLLGKLTGELRTQGLAVIDQAIGDWHSSMDFDELEATLKRGFQNLSDAGHPGFPPGVVPRGIAQRREATRRELMEKLEQHVESRLPLGARQVLAEVQALAQYARGLEQPAVGGDTSTLRDLLARLRATEDDLVLRLVPPLRSSSLLYLAREAGDELKTTFDAELAQSASETRLAILAEVREALDMWARRLQALATYSIKLHNEFARVWQEQDQSMDLNGVLIFRSGSVSADRNVAAEATLEMDYLQLLRSAPALHGVADVRGRSRQLVAEFVARRVGRENDTCTLFADVRKSYLDAIAGEVIIRRSDLEGCLDEAQHFFNASALKNDITEAFFRSFPAHDARIQQIDTIASLSDYFLAVEANDADYEAHPRKAVNWVMFRGAGESSGTAGEFKELLQSRLGTAWTYEDLDAEHGHMAIFLRERGAFPLRLVQGLSQWRTHYEAELRSKDTTSPPTLHTRRDVEWLPIHELERDELERAKELFVVGIALDFIQRPTATSGWQYAPDTRDRSVKPLTLPPEVDLAARKLRENTRTIDLLDAQVHAWRSGGTRDEELIQRLFADQGFLERIRHLGLLGLGEDVAQGANRLLTHFVARMPTLQEAYLRVFPPDPLILERLFHNEGERQADGRGTYPMAGYYCDRCKLYFGERIEKVPARCTCGRVYRG